MSAVKITNLSKNFGRHQALDNINFEIPKNCIFGVLGQNGAGKTTMFSIFAGFLKPSSGSVEVLDINVKDVSALKGRFSMLPQDAQFQSGIPVVDQLMMFARLNGMNAKQAKDAAMDSLKLVGLEGISKKSARSLSHGMAKRVALCQAFIGDPDVVVLDEPTAGLDPDNAKNVRDLVKTLAVDKTVVISSHNLHEIQETCDHVAIIHRGKLLECTDMHAFTKADSLIRFQLNAPMTAEVETCLKAIPEVEFIEPTGPVSFNIGLKNGAYQTAAPQIYTTLLNYKALPRSVHPGASLEERFLELTRG